MCACIYINTAAAAHLILIRALTKVVIGQVIAGSSIKAWSFVLAIINISLALPSHKPRDTSTIKTIEKILKEIKRFYVLHTYPYPFLLSPSSLSSSNHFLLLIIRHSHLHPLPRVKKHNIEKNSSWWSTLSEYKWTPALPPLKLLNLSYSPCTMSLSRI